MRKVIEMRHGVTRSPEWRLKEPADFVLAADEHIAIVGDNGSGKSMLVDMLTGAHPIMGTNGVHYDFGDGANGYVSSNIKHIKFRDCYGGDSDRTYFLQQRWNQMEMDEGTETVAQRLARAATTAATRADSTAIAATSRLFGLDGMEDERITLLSSGELRRLYMATAILSRPKVLIIDNPFIGLDKEMRTQFADILSQLAKRQIAQIVLIVSRASDIPDFITHIVQMVDMTVQPKVTSAEYRSSLPTKEPSSACHEAAIALVKQLPRHTSTVDCDDVVLMKGVNIRYGERTILRDLNWVIRRGEHWALTGSNGSGKSTLLSLVCADNPQGYACNISLFGRRRGSGETIWQIKHRIGYVSPEMHRAFRCAIPAWKVVASGLNDSMGLFVRPKEGDNAISRYWMRVFGIEALAERTFTKLSSGEQRLVLLARAFVKDPDLIVLDEPMHGLDARNRALVRAVVDAFCERGDKTVIFVTHYEDELPQCINRHMRLIRNS